MKTGPLPILLSVLWALNPTAALAEASETLPESRVTIVVEETERNPFGQRLAAKPLVIEQAETEEARLRALLSTMRVAGVSTGEGTAKALIGPVVAVVGRPLPALVAGQRESLRVLSVTEEKIELGFVEKDGTAETRTMSLPVKVQAEVRFKLPGQVQVPEPSKESNLEGVLNSVSSPNSAATPPTQP